MAQISKLDRSANVLSSVLLVALAAGLALATFGVTSEGTFDLTERPTLPIESRTASFDFDAYAPLTTSGGTPGWQDVVADFVEDADFYGWLRSDLANARNDANAVHVRATLTDDYATTYAAAQMRGLDLAEFEHPIALRREIERAMGY